MRAISIFRASSMTGIMMMIAAAHANDLPIRRVILYKHGVGYIERRGTVENDAELSLRFKPADMSDILKSLTVIDLGGGHVDTIAYDSTRTVDQQLDEYTFDLRQAAGLPDVLEQLKGSLVRLQVEDRTVEGRLLAVEARLETPADGQDPVARHYLGIMTEDAAAREYDFRDIQEVRFADPALRRDLEKYLATLFDRHRRDEKEVVIRSSGQGRRELLAAYIQEQPVWKVAYRLVLASERPALLQAWAIVDNVSVEDWRNVELSLVSGLPVSFRQNLYDPFFVQRREIALQAAAAVAPKVHQPAAPRARMMAARAMRAEVDGEAMADMALGAAPAESPATPDMFEHMSRQAVSAVAREAGALFVYDIPTPVTIERNRSALLPIANTAIASERFALYNAAVRAENPMDAVRISNGTGLTLEGGPLTIFEDNTYAGEALMETLKPDEDRYISFAVDLGTRVSTKHDSVSQDVYSVRIMRGNMITYHRRRQQFGYTAHNLENRAKRLVIEHPRRPGWQLKAPAEPGETSEDYLRFTLVLPPRDTAKLEVIEEQPGQSTISLSNITSDQIAYFIRQKYIDRRTQTFLEQLVELQGEIQGLREQIQSLQKEREGIFNNQTRLRENLQALGTSESERAYRTRIVRQLEGEEDRLAQIDAAILKNEQTVRAKQDELSRRLTDFTFEKEI